MEKRLHVVDALRGFAIISIMLLHNIEHFDFYFVPDFFPQWLISFDKILWDTLFFLFGGKSFAIFALLFGLTFHIQYNNQAMKNKDFRPRFAWRMFLLLCFGIINSAFYQGDILTIFAVMGLLLIPVAKLSNKTLLIISIILLLQPLEVIQLFHAIHNPSMEISNPLSWSYFGKTGNYIPNNSLWDTIIGNLTNGKTAVLLWSYENGRYFQIPALFILGLVIGRKQLFHQSEENKNFWKKILLLSSLAFICFFSTGKMMESYITSDAIRRPVLTIWTPYSNLSFMFFLVSGFTLLFQTKTFHNALNLLSPVGKMSLSNYIFQSIAGSFIYYGFGLGLYKYTDTTLATLIGLFLAAIFTILCTYWSKHFRYGPLEKIWHMGTWMTIIKE